MFPTLLTIGSFSLSTFGVFVMLGFLTYAFLVWRFARDRGLSDEKIFDMLVVVTFIALTGSRVFFVMMHWELFSVNFLRIFVIWLFPGLSFWGALFLGILTLYLYAKKQKLPVAIVFDSFGKAIPAVVIFVSFGLFFDGSWIGRETNWLIGLTYPGESGKRHPVALYSLVLTVLVSALLYVCHRNGKKFQLKNGVLGWLSLSLMGFIKLMLAFFERDLLYFEGISLSHLFATILFLGPLVPFFVLVDGQKRLKVIQSAVAQKLKQIKKHD